MQLRKIYYLLLILPMLYLASCSSDDNTTEPPVTVNQTEVLVKYLEANGNPMNTFPVMIKSSDVQANILAGADQYIIDIRDATTFAAGHIEGAVNVAAGEVLNHYEANGLATKEVVVIVCFSGQTAGWVSGLMNTLGYTNVKDMKWGMSSWNDATAGSWKNNTSNEYSTELVTTATAKPAAGDLPTLSTGQTDGALILRARVEAIFAEGFGAAKIAKADVMSNTGGYFMANYWSADHYNWNHISGAMQYTPKADLAFDTYIKTLTTDTNKPVVIYCYTGQTSAHVTAYLRVLGYNAKSLLFGVNGLSYDEMPGTKFVPETDIHDYELVN